MKEGKMEETITYKLCYAIGYIITSVIRLFLSLIWNGIIETSKRYKYMLVSYLILGVLTIITFSMDIFPWPLFLFLATSIMSGIFIHIKDAPIKKQRLYFESVFTEVELMDKSEDVPYYFTEKMLSEYVTCYSFTTTIPIKDWFSKKELMEMQFNSKIIDIVQSEKDNRVISLLVENEALPTEIPWTDLYLDTTPQLALGISHYGVTYLDLQKFPHVFIAGETGSGKSNILKCMIYQALLKDYQIVLIDFKRGVSFSAFNEIVSIFYEYETAMNILEEMVKETQHRLDLFRNNKVDNLEDFNRMADIQLKRKIIFIDELAELLKTRDKEISKSLYDSLETLTRLSRAVGIHLVMGIQRPDSTVINGQIKNNVSFRICGRFVDKEPSRIMLNSDVAATLQNIKGRFIVKDNNLTEIQCFYFSDSCASDIKERCGRAVTPTKIPCEDVEEQKEDKTTIQQKNSLEMENTDNVSTSTLNDKNIDNQISFNFEDIEHK